MMFHGGHFGKHHHSLKRRLVYGAWNVVHIFSEKGQKGLISSSGHREKITLDSRSHKEWTELILTDPAVSRRSNQLTSDYKEEKFPGAIQFIETAKDFFFSQMGMSHYGVCVYVCVGVWVCMPSLYRRPCD